MKSKAFAFITYPESSDFELIASHLTDIKVPWRRSPLHDKDVHDVDNPKTGTVKGELKKAHYHWTILFTGERDSLNIPKFLGIDEVNHVECVDDPEAAADYDTHKGFDDKAQYSPDDILMSPDYPIDDLSSYVSARLLSKRKQAIKDAKVSASLGGTRELIKIMREHDFREFCDLADFLCDFDRDDLLELFMSKTYFFDRYLTSYRNGKVVKDRLSNRIAELEFENASLREESRALSQQNIYLESKVLSELHASGESPHDALEDYHKF